MAKLLINMVGLPRFELGTSCTPSKRDTRLRYSPTQEQRLDFSTRVSARGSTSWDHSRKAPERPGVTKALPTQYKLADKPAGNTRRSEERVGKECRSRWSPNN